jgi:aldose 1-epimerase
MASIVEIRDAESGSTARILTRLGFNCFSWRAVLSDGPCEVLWAEAGFEAGDKRPSGSGTPLLFPYPGRIRGAAYEFNGRRYELEPADAFGNAIHGFVYNRPWRVVEQAGSRVVGEFHASRDDSSILERWPADFCIRVAYEVRGRQLASRVQYENRGHAPLPCGFGTHAYFRLPLSDGSRIEETIITAPVDKYWETEQMIPTGRLSAVADNHTLSTGLRLGNHQFDTCFTTAAGDGSRILRTRITDPASGRAVMQTFDDSFTQCVIYTPPHRQAICLEPYTCVPDAIRLAAAGHETGLQVLQPGEMRETTLHLEVGSGV